MSDEVPNTDTPVNEAPNMVSIREYYTTLKNDLSKRVSEIEAFLSFVEGAEALGTRLAKIEQFLGIKA